MQRHRGRDSRDGKIAWLASLPWWRDLDRRHLRTLAATGDRATVPAGRTIMHDGQIGHETAVIVSGEVEVVHDGEVLARLGPGEVVGELSLLSGTHRVADVRTVTETELLVFSVSGLRQVLAAATPVREQVLSAAADHGG